MTAAKTKTRRKPIGAWCDPERRCAVEALLRLRIGPIYEERRRACEALLEELADLTLPADRLAAAIAEDAELALYLHERENRPFFGAVSGNHDLAELILILGREKIARLVLAHALRRAFRPEPIVSRRVTEGLWNEGRRAAEYAARVGVETAQRHDGGVVDVRALDAVYARALLVPLGAVASLYLGELAEPVTNEAEVVDLRPGELAATILLDFGGSVHVAADLAAMDDPEPVRDRNVDLMTVGLALARRDTLGDTAPPTPEMLLRLGFDPGEWPELLRVS